MRLPPPVLALSPGGLAAADVPLFVERVRRAVRGGLRGVLLREPGLDERALLALARTLRSITAEVEDGWLGVHDRAHAARLAAADGLHLGFRSLPPARVPVAWRGGVALGFSAHAHDGPSAWTGADYLIFGPLRHTPSKRGVLEPSGFGGLAEAVRAASVPVWAIGGLGPEHVAEALAAGASGVCTLSGILERDDPAGAARAYLEAAGAAVR